MVKLIKKTINIKKNNIVIMKFKSLFKKLINKNIIIDENIETNIETNIDVFNS